MKTLTASTLLLSLCLLQGCAHKPAKTTPVTPGKLTPSAMVQAEEARVRGDQKTALRHYGEQLKAEPTQGAALLGAGEALLSLGRYEAASTMFEKVVVGQAEYTQAQEGLALTQLALGNHERAQRLLMGIYHGDAFRWRTLNGLGTLADLQGDYDAALGWYEQALSAPGAEALVYNNYGYSRLMARQFPHAEALFNRALQLGGDNEGLRNNLMQAIAWQGDYSRSLRARGEVAQHVALNNIGYIALLRGDKDGAIRYLQQAIDQSPAWYGLAFSNLERAQSLSAARP